MLIKYCIFIGQFEVEQLKSSYGKKKEKKKHDFSKELPEKASEDQSKQRWSQTAFRTHSMCPSLWTTLFTCLWFHFEASLSITLKATVFVSRFSSTGKGVIHQLQDTSTHTHKCMLALHTHTLFVTIHWMSFHPATGSEITSSYGQ